LRLFNIKKKQDKIPLSFKVDATIYPIAMKYDSRFGDAFWNSSEQSYFEYLLQMMTSWALICHVWYLPKMQKEVWNISIFK
jgi:glycerol-3-phosphate O-acyltransferase 3/4